MRLRQGKTEQLGSLNAKTDSAFMWDSVLSEYLFLLFFQFFSGQQWGR